jgi:acyl-coenzyme A thioesterase PaaI-like protein
LIERNDAVAFVDEAGMRLAKIIAGKARATVETKDRFAAASETVDGNAIAIDLDVKTLVRLHLAPHAIHSREDSSCSTFGHD